LSKIGYAHGAPKWAGFSFRSLPQRVRGHVQTALYHYRAGNPRQPAPMVHRRPKPKPRAGFDFIGGGWRKKKAKNPRPAYTDQEVVKMMSSWRPPAKRKKPAKAKNPARRFVSWRMDDSPPWWNAATVLDLRPGAGKIVATMIDGSTLKMSPPVHEFGSMAAAVKHADGLNASARARSGGRSGIGLGGRNPKRAKAKNPRRKKAR
jgi:hypothetical protein